MNRTKAFISYSHKDELWKDRLMTQLAILEFEGRLHQWSDTRIDAGDDWYQRIQNAMDDSRVAVLLVSADFLASKFIRNEEVPRLLQLHAERGMLILPLIARPCAWQLVPWLSRKQVRPKSGKPLSSGSLNDSDADLAAFTYEVASLIDRFTGLPSTAVNVACSKVDDASKAIQDTDCPLDDRAVMSVLALAIEHGAPVYNAGLPIDCVLIYRHAATRLMELISVNKPTERQAMFVRGIREAERLLPPVLSVVTTVTPENADRLAWKLRNAFDQILDVSRTNRCT